VAVSGLSTTRDDSSLAQSGDARPPIPGLVQVLSAGKPSDRPIRLDQGPVEFGRAEAPGVIVLDDERTSRRHTRVTLSAEGIRVEDLGSRNGTFVDGRQVKDERFATAPCVLRVGRSLFLFVPDIHLFVHGGVQVTELGVSGPKLRAVLDRIARAAKLGTLLITGPSGSGKELAARRFHAASHRKGPFVAVNCATIPAGLAERLLFGARRGAYSGASTDADGYVQAADTGTLFLDEIAELDAAVQPKLLRMLEMREVTPLGASRAQKVDVQVCAATLKDLRAEVDAGRFREDLYYRIGRPEERLPGLAERLEEIPWLVAEALQRVDPTLVPGVSLIEVCLLRPWPGNVRELLIEARYAAGASLADGRTVVEASHLLPTAGRPIREDPSGERAPATLQAPPSRGAVEEALRSARGNVSAASRELGLHRTQFRRLMERYHIDPKVFLSGPEEEGTSSGGGAGEPPA
jgi:transcriptional regulator of acetoin/glycerol metabolism